MADNPKPVYQNGRIIGTTTDGKTMTPIADTMAKLRAGPTQFEKANTPEPDWGFTPGHLAQQGIQGIKELATGTWGMAKDVASKQPLATTYKKDVVAPLEEEMNQAVDLWKQGRYSEATGHYIASYIPFLGPWAASLGEQIGKQDVGGALARAGSQVGLAEGIRKSPLMLRSVAGAGDAAVDRASKLDAEKRGEAQADYNKRLAETVEENKRALSAARQSHEEDVATTDRDNAQAAQKHHDLVTRINTFNDNVRTARAEGASASAVADRVADNIADTLPQIAAEETARAKAAYPQVDGSVSRAGLHASLGTIIDSRLKGSGSIPTSLAKILKDTEPLDEKAPVEPAERLNQMATARSVSPEQLQDVLNGHVTFEDLHGMYSELGREAYRGDIPGDSKAAIKGARTHILNLMTRLSDAAHKTEDFRRAQYGWMVLENVFRNDSPPSQGGSPIARALNARDPITGKLRTAYVRSILMDPKAHGVALDLLSNYPEATKELRWSMKILKQYERVAKTGAHAERTQLKDTPAPPHLDPYPSSAKVGLKEPPGPPSTAPFDAAKWRDREMEKWAISGKQLRAYNFMPWRLPFTLFQQISSRMLLDPKFRERLAAIPSAKERKSVAIHDAGAQVRKILQTLGMGQ